MNNGSEENDSRSNIAIKEKCVGKYELKKYAKFVNIKNRRL